MVIIKAKNINTPQEGSVHNKLTAN